MTHLASLSFSATHMINPHWVTNSAEACECACSPGWCSRVCCIHPQLFKNVTLWPIGRLKASLADVFLGGQGGLLGVQLKCQRTKVLPFKTSWHFHQGQTLLSVSEREDGKRKPCLDILASKRISCFICVLPVDTVSVVFLVNKWREHVCCLVWFLMVRCQQSPRYKLHFLTARFWSFFCLFLFLTYCCFLCAVMAVIHISWTL